MKKCFKVFLMLFCIASISSFVSCSKDNEDLIVGKWKYTQDLPTKGFGLDDADILIFNADGTGAWYSEDGFGMTFMYSINGDMINFYSIDCRIEELTKSKLVLASVRSDGSVYYRAEFTRQ